MDPQSDFQENLRQQVGDSAAKPAELKELHYCCEIRLLEVSKNRNSLSVERLKRRGSHLPEGRKVGWKGCVFTTDTKVSLGMNREAEWPARPSS